MVKQIAIDENNIVCYCSVGGIIENGIDVDDIPDEVMACPSRWKFEGGRFVENVDYNDRIDINTTKADKIAESKMMLAEWFETHPYQHTDGKYYSCTEEKQSLLNGNLASYERATQAGIPYPLKWNSTGDECLDWSYSDLVALSLSIAGYVAPKVSMQQAYELQIKACQSVDEINEIVIDYD